jgi:acetylornithine deacetylase/succinyl-diaminopimelate desuccinylase-like protein
MQNGRLTQMSLQTSEKVYLSFELEATNAGGHSALPTRENAILRLATALARLDGFAFPLALNPTTRAYFAQLAAREPSDLAAAFRGVIAEPPEPAAVARLSAIPFYDASLRTTCTPTLLAAGHAENALPQRASATLQCRLLPGDDPTRVREALAARLADPQIELRPKSAPLLAPESPLEPELLAALREATESCWPGVPVVPVMDVWASDGASLRSAGIPVYGISGIFFDVDDVRSHGRDERIAVAAFEQGLELMGRLMRRVGGAPR